MDIVGWTLCIRFGEQNPSFLRAKHPEKLRVQAEEEVRLAAEQDWLKKRIQKQTFFIQRPKNKRPKDGVKVVKILDQKILILCCFSQISCCAGALREEERSEIPEEEEDGNAKTRQLNKNLKEKMGQ